MMGIPESIQEWGDWSRNSNGSSGAEGLKYVCQSKRYVSDIQIQLEGVRAQLQSAESALGDEVQSARSTIESHIDEFLILFRRLLAPLHRLNVGGVAEQMECKAYLQATDWDQCIFQALYVLKALETLPDPFSQGRNNRQSQIWSVVDLCTRLVTASSTARRRDLSPAEAKLMIQKLNNVAIMGA